jgi:hypothetical protein
MASRSSGLDLVERVWYLWEGAYSHSMVAGGFEEMS